MTSPFDGYGATLATGTYDLRSFTIGGTFTPVPEPAAVLAVAVAGLWATRRRLAARQPG